MKMVDMGKKHKNDEAPMPSTGSKSHVSYPRLDMYDKVPPELMKKDVGDMCRIEVIGKIVNKGVRDDENGKRESMDIEIHKMGYIGKAGKRTKEEYSKMNQDEKEAYDKESVGL